MKKTANILIIASIAIGFLITISTAAVLTSNQVIPSSGTLTPITSSVNIGVYSNSDCSQNATFVGWGMLSPGDMATKIIWIKNNGEADATLTLTTNNWSPATASQAIALSWTKENSILAPSEVVQATLTLSISPGIDSSITSYNFNIIITGTG